MVVREMEQVDVKDVRNEGYLAVHKINQADITEM